VATGEHMMKIWVFDWISNSKSSVTPLKMLSVQDIHQHTKQVKMWSRWRNLSSKTEKQL